MIKQKKIRQKLGGFSNLSAARDNARPASDLQTVANTLARHFNLQVSENTLKQFVDTQSKDFSISSFQSFCDAFDLSVKKSAVDIKTLNPLALPVLCFDQQGNPVLILNFDTVGDTLRIYAPKTSDHITSIPKNDLVSVVQKNALYVKKISARAPQDVTVAKEAISLRGIIRSQYWIVSQVLLAAVFSNLLGLVVPVYTMVVYDRILPNSATESLIVITVGVAVALIFDFVLKILRSQFLAYVSHDVDRKLGGHIMQSLSQIPVNRLRLQSAKLGQLFSAFDTLKDFLTSAAVVSFVDFPFIFLYLFVIYLIGGYIVIVPASVVILSIMVALITHFRVTSAHARSTEARVAKNQVISELASGIEYIKVGNLFGVVQNRYFQILEKFSGSRDFSKRSMQTGAQLLSTLQQSAQIAVIFYGVFLVQQGNLTMGGLIACVILLGKALAPVIQVSQTLMRLNDARQARKTIDDFLGFIPSLDSATISETRLLGNYRVENVQVVLDPQKPATFDDLSLKISQGEKICILGTNGSGKSTVIRLLAGLLDPDKGSVFLDNMDLRKVNRVDLAANIGVVFQDAWIFSGTIRENLTAMRPATTMKELSFALQLTGADRLIAKLDNGLEFKLGEFGAGISQGELQLLSVTRAVLHRPNIFLFDEPTSFLDGNTEKRLISNISAAFPRSTFVFVTHRPEILSIVDRVIEMKAGRINRDLSVDEFRSLQNDMRKFEVKNDR